MPRFQPILLCKNYQLEDQDKFHRMLEGAIDAVADKEVFLSPIIISAAPLRGVYPETDVHQGTEDLFAQLKSGREFAERKAPYDPAVFIDIGNCGDLQDIRTKALQAVPGVHRGYNVLVHNGVTTRPAPFLIVGNLRDVAQINPEHFEGLVFFNHDEAREIINDFAIGVGKNKEVSAVVGPFRFHYDSCLAA